ncbi:MAG: Aminodeoxychorismate lyase (EC, partial [uncultured Sulfurovum sp.]
MKKPIVNSMLFETIKVKDGKIFNLPWHNQRFNLSRKKLFHASLELDLAHYIEAPQIGLYRCKVIYNHEIQSIEFFPYEAKIFKTFKIINSQLDYSYKYTDRSKLQALLDKGFDDIIIEKDGLLTDTSIANIAFFDGDSWLTPKVPLLKGTTRARLLDEGFLKLSEIKKVDLIKYKNFALMNAMIGFRIQKSVSI